MVTIQLELPEHVAARFQHQKHNLAQILERALDELEREATPLLAKTTSEDERLETALRLAGAVGPTAEQIQHYVESAQFQRWQPLKIPGQPMSETIIQDRR